MPSTYGEPGEDAHCELGQQPSVSLVAIFVRTGHLRFIHREYISLTLSYGNFMTIFVFIRVFEGMFVDVANFEDAHEREDGHQE